MMDADLQEELLDVSRSFIRFGAVLDVASRKYLVAWIQSELIKNYQLPEELQPGYFELFQEELKSVLNDPVLKEITHQHDYLAVQVVKDLLHWLRRTIGKSKAKNPHEEEQQQLESWSVRPIKQLSQSYAFVFKTIGNYYTRDEFPTAFYEKEFKHLFEGAFESLDEAKKERADQVFTDLLSQWDAKLQAKIIAAQLRVFRDDLEEMSQSLSGKAMEFKQLTSLIAPFSDYTGKYWNMAEDLWSKTSFNVLDNYSELLEKEEELKRLAEMLGQLREAEIQTEEEQYQDVEIKRSKVHDPMLKSEITGIFESNDLNQLLSSEIALLADAHTETVFFKKFADEMLLTNQFKDHKIVESDELVGYSRELKKRKEKGPFIVCVDTSGSMEGTPEHIAKVLCFGILKMAAKEQRKCFLINFSTGIQTLDLQHISNNVDELAHFLSMSFQGGTDISLALHESIEQLNTKNYKEADVLVISDFVMYKLDPRLVKMMQHEQSQNNTQFHSLVISDQAVEEVIEVFDHVWVYRPEEKGIMHTLHQDLSVMMRNVE
jgi:uncharacterized protein with von Willebrand factor type A (vWA) domain